MTIATRDALIDALGNNNSRIIVDKGSIANMVAGQYASLWRATGVPGQGAIPTTAAIPTSATTGALGFTNQTAPVTSYHALQSITGSNSAMGIEFHDRVAHMGGLSGTVTTAQGALDVSTLGLVAARRGDANYSDLMWWLEIYTNLGATGVNATVGVTYDDGSTGNLTAFALGATPRAGRMYPLVSAVAGRFIRGVTGVTLSATTGTAGNFGITTTRPRSITPIAIANKTEVYDWATLGFPNIPNDSCLQLIAMCSTTSTGTVRGIGKIIHG